MVILYKYAEYIHRTASTEILLFKSVKYGIMHKMYCLLCTKTMFANGDDKGAGPYPAVRSSGGVEVINSTA